MIKYDIAYSLNGQKNIEANSWEEAESKLRDWLRDQKIDLKQLHLEVFDVNEEEVKEENIDMIVIGRPIGGISLNGLEFLLDGPDGDYLKFESKVAAMNFVNEEVFPDSTDEELENYFTFMTEGEARAYEAND